MPNYGYREKYEKVIHDFYTDGRKEVIQHLYYFLKEELAPDNRDTKLEIVLDSMNYTFADSIRDSVYCLPYHECLIILEYLTDFNDYIENVYMSPCGDPNSPHEQYDDENITGHLTEIMRNWIYNGINSMFNYLLDRNRTVLQNMAKLERDHNDVLNIKDEELSTPQRFSFDIRAGTTTEDEPITNIDKVIIAYNMDEALEYVKDNYSIDGMDEVASDELSIFYEKSYLGQLSDHGNINEVTSAETLSDIQDEENNIKPEYQSEYGYWRDTVEINGSEISDKDYKYMISGNYHNPVVDLTK